MQRDKVRFRRSKSGATYTVISASMAEKIMNGILYRKRVESEFYCRFGFRNMTGPFTSRHYANSEWRLYFS